MHWTEKAMLKKDSAQLSLPVIQVLRHKMDIEEDLRTFLSERRQLDYDYSQAEAGEVGLCSIDELKVGIIWISPPNNGDGYYEIPAISITNKNEDYEPEFILLWLPNEKLYGSWDCDHWELIIFPNTSWSDISAEPLQFVNAQWDSEQGIGQKFLVTDDYMLNEGMPF